MPEEIDNDTIIHTALELRERYGDDVEGFQAAMQRLAEKVGGGEPEEGEEDID